MQSSLSIALYQFQINIGKWLPDGNYSSVGTKLPYLTNETTGYVTILTTPHGY